jgi:hypothetical protein
MGRLKRSRSRWGRHQTFSRRHGDGEQGSQIDPPWGPAWIARPQPFFQSSGSRWFGRRCATSSSVGWFPRGRYLHSSVGQIPGNQRTPCRGLARWSKWYAQGSLRRPPRCQHHWPGRDGKQHERKMKRRRRHGPDGVGTCRSRQVAKARTPQPRLQPRKSIKMNPMHRRSSTNETNAMNCIKPKMDQRVWLWCRELRRATDGRPLSRR